MPERIILHGNKPGIFAGHLYAKLYPRQRVPPAVTVELKIDGVEVSFTELMQMCDDSMEYLSRMKAEEIIVEAGLGGVRAALRAASVNIRQALNKVTKGGA